VASLPDRLAVRLPGRWGRFRPILVDTAVLSTFAGALFVLAAVLQRRVR
jgi:hypothetical protein